MGDLLLKIISSFGKDNDIWVVKCFTCHKDNSVLRSYSYSFAKDIHDKKKL